MIKIHNLARDFNSYLARLSEENLNESKEIWEEVCYFNNEDVYNHIYDLYRKIDSSIKLSEEALKIINIDELSNKIYSISSRLEHNMEDILAVFQEHGIVLDDENELNVYIVVGNGTTNAIVTGYQTASLFLFVESLPDAKYFKILLAHELFHVMHRHSKPCQIEEIQLVDLLISEGLACSTSKIMNDGLEISEYLDFNKGNYDESRLNFIKDKREQIKRDFTSNDWEVIRNYISYGDFQHHRIGYDIGYLVLQEMLKKDNIKTIMEMPFDYVRSIFIKEFDYLLNSTDNTTSEQWFTTK
ncbi:hypothetical protein EZV73_27360 [Acidaminobacter sp. JC074]|uniref:DUF2268 domain-containing putative Zn-dependent protease n=1 Tax=Acidaminobacter sp. JC074 TaxID=2530199 RepID=UPI001F0DC0D3|nr:DUF2268 domain-containing putative Zn-dependent protease [Acidaminobacter sp. JC074]MCH4891319.1 hypothetical protein [Acidaminobacter sp. JC074]